MKRGVGASLKWDGGVWGNPGWRFEEILGHRKTSVEPFPRISGNEAGLGVKLKESTN